MNPVEIVTVKNKIPLFKGEEQANAIELIELEEVGYELVANKTLYEIGDKAVLIQPDYCVSDISLFESFIRPINRKTGIPDESMSMLGKIGGLPRRIRAKKFTLSKEPNGDSVYSNGILLPISNIEHELQIVFDSWKNINLTECLNITKYEEPEHTNKYGIKTGLTEGKFPEGLYKTDEENINNLWNHIENKIGYPITLVGTEKIDGSSITIGVTPKIPEGFICSRNLRKKLTITKRIGTKNLTLWDKFNQWLFNIGLRKKMVDLGVYEEVENDDDFVRYGKPYLDQLLTNTQANLKLEVCPYPYIVLRGELNGGKLKGSGNKNNPASKEQPNIKFFGADKVNEDGTIDKMHYIAFKNRTNTLNFPTVKEVFNKEFNSKQELLNECNLYFKENMIEGIVVRTLDSQFSAKVMNLEYDSKK